MARLQLNVTCPINFLGYGQAATNILDGLDQNDVLISLFPINPQNMEAHSKHHKLIHMCMENARDFDYNADSLLIWHQFAMERHVGHGYKIGFPFFELNKFNDLEKHNLNYLDKIFIASNWAADIVKQNGIEVKTHLIPLGVDRSIFKESSCPYLKDECIFLTVGKFEYRKGHDVVLKAFDRAFREDDKVVLWMMCDNPITPSENIKWRDRANSIKLNNKVKFIPRQSSSDDVARIMQMADYGLFPARAEGWNMELLEMMSCGKKCIATNYSAHTEYCDDKNCELLNISELEIANDGVYFNGFGEWAHFSDSIIDEMAQRMRNMYDRQQKSKDIFNYSGIETAKRFSWYNTGKEIVNVLS